jgi:uncharacterized membrane protein
MKLEKFLNFEGYISALLGTVVGFVAPIGPFIGLMVGLVISDLITGIRAAKKRGESINSKGFRRTLEKVGVYLVALLSAKGVQIVFVPALPLAYSVAFWVCVTEFKSILENVTTVTGTPIWEHIKNLLKK